MDRPLEDKRPFGPFIGGSEELQVLDVRQDGYPKIIIEVDNTDDSVFDVINARAKFEVYDITIELNEGQVGTREMPTQIITIFSDDKEVDNNYIQHIINVMESKYTVYNIDIGGYIKREPEEVGMPDSIDMGFKEESTEVNK